MFRKFKEYFDIVLFKKMFLTSIIQFIIPWIVLTTLFAVLMINNYNKERLSFNMTAIANSKEMLDSQLSNINSLTYIFFPVNTIQQLQIKTLQRVMFPRKLPTWKNTEETYRPLFYFSQNIRV